MAEEYAIEINGLKKEYRLGTIGGGTLSADLQSFVARKLGKEDPNALIGEASGQYGQRFLALQGIDLKVMPGEAVGIIGHNGAGKSTLLKILSRVTAPTEGTAVLNGRVSSMLEVGTGFHPELTGRENIYMNGAILGMTRKEVDAKMEEIIEFSECRQFIDTPVKRYSSGMYVKLAFAVAAHLDAEIMIMDEVLAVGDVKFQKKCLSRMDGAAHNEGKTVLYVSHNMATIRQLCTRCIVLDHGRVIFDGDVEEAIAIYVDQDRSDFPAHYDLSESKRPAADFGTYMRVMDFTFEGKDRAIFAPEEPLRYRFSYDCQGSGQEFGVYYTICHEDGTIVGTEFSESLGETDNSCRQQRCLTGKVTGLIPGNYYFYFDVFYRNEFGTIYSVDHPEQKIHFQIAAGEKDDGINWLRKDFGSVRFPNITVGEQ